MDHLILHQIIKAATILAIVISMQPSQLKALIMLKNTALSIGVPKADDNKIRCDKGLFVKL